MKSPIHRSRARSVNVLASAGVTLAALVVLGTVGSPRSHAAPEQTSGDPWEGSSFTTPSSFATSSDAVFSGVFKHSPPAPISSVVLHLEFSAMDTPASGCRPAPDDETMTYSTTTTTTIEPSTTTPGTGTSTPSSPSTPTTQTPSDSSQVQFSFRVPFTCNGVYDATATANIEDPTGDTPPPLKKSISVVGVRVAVPPASPASITAADNGNHSVTVSWGAPTSYTGGGHPPPDFVGYRVSRQDGSGAFAPLGDTSPTTLSFVDSSIPAAGGSFVYEVESLRKFASSPPMVTSGPLTIGGPRSASGGSTGAKAGGGKAAAPDPGAGGTGSVFYDPTTLAADEGEPGDDALSGVPGGGTIQRFAGHAGAGLLKPFAAALDLGVWAGLLLFLTRRASKAERAALLALELEASS